MTGTAPDDRGFSLVELMAVVAVVGVLVAIAVPALLRHRQQAAEVAALGDVRTTVTVIEGWMGRPGTTLDDLDGATGAHPQLREEGLRLGAGMRVAVSVTGRHYCIEGTHDSLPGQRVRYRSDVGDVEIGATASTSC